MPEDIIAVFPLPNVVFFPRTRLPLHIFEPRYCEMVKQTLKNHQLIGMFVLESGWEQNYYGNPPVYPVGCAGEIVHATELEDGKYDIVLQGLYRARAIEEIQMNPYRKARVEILSEKISGPKQIIQRAQRNLITDFRKLCMESGNIDSSALDQLSDFSELVNNVAMLLPLELDVKLGLLCEENIVRRATMLEDILRKQLTMFSWIKQYSRLRPKEPDVN